jgi:hypothetical protein
MNFQPYVEHLIGCGCYRALPSMVVVNNVCTTVLPTHYKEESLFINAVVMVLNSKHGLKMGD